MQACIWNTLNFTSSLLPGWFSRSINIDWTVGCLYKKWKIKLYYLISFKLSNLYYQTLTNLVQGDYNLTITYQGRSSISFSNNSFKINFTDINGSQWINIFPNNYN